MPSGRLRRFGQTTNPPPGSSDDPLLVPPVKADDQSAGAVSSPQCLPRLIRLKDAPCYLGMDKNIFNRDVRPTLTEIRHGRAVLFDRLDLDAWADSRKAAYERQVQR